MKLPKPLRIGTHRRRFRRWRRNRWRDFLDRTEMDGTQVLKLLFGVVGLASFIAIHYVADTVEDKRTAYTVLAAHLVPLTFIPRGPVAPWRIMVDVLPKALLSGCLYVTVFEWIEKVAAHPINLTGVLIVVVSVPAWAYSMMLLGVAHLELLQAEMKKNVVTVPTPPCPHDVQDEQRHEDANQNP